MANQSQQRIAPPIPFLTAAWAGMSREDIRAGLRNGDIVQPGQLPEWAADVDDRAAPATSRTQRAMPETVDRARVSGWFEHIDPELSSSAFDSIWQEAGADDGERAANLTSFLSRVLLRQGAAEDAGGIGRTNDARQLDAVLAAGDRQGTVVDLSGKTGQDLAALAKTDVGYRYALAHLDSVAVTGNRAMFAGANVDGSLDRFDADTGEALVSDAWLADRGKFLAWKLSGESGESMIVAGNQDWMFVDRAAADAEGQPLAIAIETGVAGAGKNQVVFGTSQDEVFKGLTGSDRIYAGAGDDVLRGGAGGDRLEGGDGDDLAMGGGGNDELSGGRGDDELDGGRGDDRLEGGSGDDTYVIDRGDGADTIVDADGVGAIELDGQSLSGGVRGSDGTWRSVDQQVEFSFTGDLETGGTLTISHGNSNDAGEAPGTVTVNNWKNGDLGITLGDGEDQTGQPAPLGSNEGETTPASTADVTTDPWEDLGVSSLDGSGSATNGEPAPDAFDSQGEEPPPYAGEGAIESTFDFDAALEALLGNGGETLDAVNPTSYQQAVDAFSGVLEPPDVSGVGFANDSADLGTVTESAMADALAGDYAPDAFDGYEPTYAQALPSVDVASLMEMKQGGVEVRSRAGG